jgi:protein-disulfide isomerase
MQKDLDEIKAALKPTPPKAIIDAPPGMTVPIADAPTRGDAGARIVLVEFSDYECPFCGRFVRDSYPSIARDYIQTGKVRHVFRAFPLESIHKNALKAHEATACAGEQGKYWQLHDVLFANQRALTPSDLVQHAATAGLDLAAFRSCLDGGRMTARVRKDIDAGMQLGVQGTPLFLIGTVNPDGQVAVRKGISGAQPYSVFKQAFDDVAAGK